MTKENREKLYSHYKDLAENYVAPDHLNSGLTATSVVRRNAENHVKEMLKAHPELENGTEKLTEELDKKKVFDKEPKKPKGKIKGKVK